MPNLSCLFSAGTIFIHKGYNFKVMDEYNSLLIQSDIRPLAFIDPEKSKLFGTLFY